MLDQVKRCLHCAWNKLLDLKPHASAYAGNAEATSESNVQVLGRAGLLTAINCTFTG